MSALTVLLASATAAFGAVVGNLFAAFYSRGASSRQRYALWTLAFWCGPAIGLLTTYLAVSVRTRPAAAPTGLVRLVRSTDHASLGLVVAGALLIVSAGALLRLTALVVATLRAGSLAADARRIGQRLAFADRGDGRRGVPVLASDAVQVPVLAGVFRPAVLVPAPLVERLHPAQLAMIVDHELVHARRADNVRLWAEEAATALMWWSPATLKARRNLRIERETSCDAVVLSGADREERADYARTLLQVMGRIPPLATAYSPAASEAARRIHLVVDGDVGALSRHNIALATLALACAVIAVPRVASGAIAATGASFAATRAVEMYFQATPGRDWRTGRRIYEIHFKRHGPATDELLAPTPRAQNAPLAVQRLRDGHWRLTLG